MIYLDVRPLLSANFSGIPQLTWHLIKYWLNAQPDDIRFFVGAIEIERTEVEKIVSQRTGRYFHATDRALKAARPLHLADARRSVALHPHTRPMRGRVFGRTVQVIHDLTALLTPELHPRDLVESETRRLFRDRAYVDHFICVSEASRSDLIRYLGIESAKTSVAYPGVAWFDNHVDVYNQIADTNFKKYVLILGTFEPRKNVEFIFEYLRKYPSILNEYTFCFCGGDGWGGIYDRCVSNPTIEKLIREDKVRIYSFVDENLKYVLMREASFLIYASFIEGFGSPVAESLSVGVPVVTSFGGSLPEVAGDVGYYFDPYSLDSLDMAIQRVVHDLTYKLGEVRISAYRQGEKFTWGAFTAKVAEAVTAELEALAC